ncbi:DUF3040 domain-containing protein [Cellulomonas sp. PhB143]|uniref:DUF3040 domain-containing protein n=1 Tax=Cellulomonas sp. PhB143 TaxID=2485186 RepID=UPI000F4A1B41|nr:DUF3040 domain-containing protein [Cellulomonas sp. PhB143]ROS77200.1 DUF3040 family protein [Cellulomonas sp. PhB143]
MPLSEYEQRVLEQMERALTSDDPRLATTLQTAERRSALRWLVAGCGVVGGLLLLVVGVTVGDGIGIAIGVVGFAIMFAGVAFALARPRRRGGSAGQVPGRGEPRTRESAPSSGGGFFNRLEERWERRRGSDGR